MTAPAVEVHGLRKAFGSVQAVDDVSFFVHPGEILGFLGPNGAGKTTTIRSIMGVVAADAGLVRIHGRAPDRDLRRRIGYLPEERGLHLNARLLDAVAYLGELKGMPRGLARTRAEAWLIRLELGDALQRRTKELSRGMAQKAQVAAALINDPDILILDEPTQNLDPINVELLLGIIQEQRADGRALVISTHVMSQVESLADRIYLIAEGRGILTGEVADVRRRYAPNAVRFETPDSVDGVAGITNLRREGDGYYAELMAGATPDRVLRALVTGGIRVNRFERVLASLDDVFIQAVREARSDA